MGTPREIQTGAVARWLAKEFGGRVTSAEDTKATGATPSKVTNNDPDAVALLFINLGAFDIYLSLSTQTSTTNGIFLGANGGSVSFKVRDDGELSSREWNAVSPGGASTLYINRTRVLTQEQQ
jgi:hypothetical protein